MRLRRWGVLRLGLLRRRRDLRRAGGGHLRRLTAAAFLPWLETLLHALAACLTLLLHALLHALLFHALLLHALLILAWWLLLDLGRRRLQLRQRLRLRRRSSRTALLVAHIAAAPVIAVVIVGAQVRARLRERTAVVRLVCGGSS